MKWYESKRERRNLIIIILIMIAMYRFNTLMAISVAQWTSEILSAVILADEERFLNKYGDEYVDIGGGWGVEIYGKEDESITFDFSGYPDVGGNRRLTGVNVKDDAYKLVGVKVGMSRLEAEFKLFLNGYWRGFFYRAPFQHCYKRARCIVSLKYEEGKVTEISFGVLDMGFSDIDF